MAKSSSSKRLYAVKLNRGKNHPEWQGFYLGVTDMNGKAPDYGGINNLVVIGTHHDPITVLSLVSGHMKSDKGLTVEEITIETLQTKHAGLMGLVRNYFLPYGDYPAVDLP